MALRKKWWIVGLLVIAATATGVTLARRWPLGTGSAAPVLDVQWLQGEPVDPRRPDGRIVVVEAWATWCGPCIGSIPELDAVARRYADRGVRVVAVAVLDELAKVQEFVARRGPEVAFAIAFDHDGQVQRQWRTEWIGWYLPCTFVVDGTGRIETVTSPWGLDGVLRRMLARRDANANDGVQTGLAERYWTARNAKDAAAAVAAAEEATTVFPGRAFAWSWWLQAIPAGERVPLVKRGLAAVRGDANECAQLVDVAWEVQCLPAIASEANEVLAPGEWIDVGFVMASARLLAAHVVGREAFDRAIEAAIRGFATRPSELPALARDLVRSRSGADGSALVLPPELSAAALRLVEAALPTFAPWHVARQHYELLVANGADAARLDAAGRRAVDGMRGSAIELNSFAWDLLQDEAHLPATRAIALLAAEAMAETPHANVPNHLDTLALARFENGDGDVDGAIAAQERALAGLRDPDARFTQRLERYRAAKTSSSVAPR